MGDGPTIKARLGFADEYGLAGIALWVAGRDDARLYTELCSYYGTWCKHPMPGMPFPANVALRASVSGTASFDDHYTVEKATDGTHREGFLADPDDAMAWISVDLTKSIELVEARIRWGKADWATTYRVDISNDGKNWVTAGLVDGGDGGVDTVDLLGLAARYVRLVCFAKADWSYEVYELEVIGITLPGVIPLPVYTVVEQTPPTRAPDGNLAIGRPAVASSSFDGFYTASRATDANYWVGWLADPKDQQATLTVDLGSVQEVVSAAIHWGKHDWPSAYQVLVSTDGKRFESVFRTSEGQGGEEQVTFPSTPARYVRVLCEKKVDWSYEIYELKVFQ